MRLALYLIREQGVILKSIGSSLFLIFVGRCSFWGGILPSWKTGGMYHFFTQIKEFFYKIKNFANTISTLHRQAAHDFDIKMTIFALIISRGGDTIVPWEGEIKNFGSLRAQNFKYFPFGIYHKLPLMFLYYWSMFGSSFITDLGLVLLYYWSMFG